MADDRKTSRDLDEGGDGPRRKHELDPEVERAHRASMKRNAELYRELAKL